MTSIKLRTSPVLVAAVLAHYDEHGFSATTRNCKIHKRTLCRWLDARNENPAWLEEQAALWATRDHAASRAHAAQLADYRKRRYLTGLQMIPAIGTQRRVRALHALGWTAVHIAEYGDWRTPNAVSEVHKRQRVTKSTAAAIESAYAALSMRVGPSETTRRLAARRGWPGPLEWDDIDNDTSPHRALPADDTDDGIDPVVIERILAGDWRHPATPAERYAVLDRWTRSDSALEKLTRWNIARMRRDRKAAA